MYVRHFQSHLSGEELLFSEKVSKLQGCRVGVDVVHWLRSVRNIKDPFAGALGGVAPGLFGFLDQELKVWRQHDITPVFVVQGIPPRNGPTTMVNQDLIAAAWSWMASGEKEQAARCFAESVSRVNVDLLDLVLRRLRFRGCEVVRAPYLAGAQLAQFMDQGLVDAVFAPPGLLLFNVHQVLLEIRFSEGSYTAVKLEDTLAKCLVNQVQFVDACMLAGTEYCPGMLDWCPWQWQITPQSFAAAIAMARCASLNEWVQVISPQETQMDYCQRYYSFKVLLLSTPAFHSFDRDVRPPASTLLGPSSMQSTWEFNQLFGEHLPNGIHSLMMQGIISHDLPQAFAMGEWVDATQPHVDTVEFWTFLTDMQDYRERALGLLAPCLQPQFHNPLPCRSIYWQGYEQNTLHPRNFGARLEWTITEPSVDQELVRQNVQQVDFKFALLWHAHDKLGTGGTLCRCVQHTESRVSLKDQKAFSAFMHFSLLEQLEFIAEDGCMTAFGDILMNSPLHLQEPCLLALVMMKFGALNGEAFQPSSLERPFPQAIRYPTGRLDSATRSKFLLCRTVSLVPMTLKTKMWNAEVDFDLAGFHSLLQVLSRSLRQLGDAVLASVLLKEMEPGEIFQQTAPLSFAVPRTCMGIVCKFFLEYDGVPCDFPKQLASHFPCCEQPLADLRSAFFFWEYLRKCIVGVAELVGAEDLSGDMITANKMLLHQQRKLHLEEGCQQRSS